MAREAWMKSGSQGWIKVEVLSDVEFTEGVGGVIIGPGMGHTKVYILEGKHKGDTIEVPRNYVTFTPPSGTTPSRLSSAPGATGFTGETLGGKRVFVTKKGKTYLV